MKNFMPSAGEITQYLVPGGYGVRVDSACYNGYTIPPYYDSMVAKLIVHQPTREEAIQCALRALDEYIIMGIHTTIPFHQALLKHPVFRSAEYSTDFLNEHKLNIE